jgi:hypothetical protein
LTKCLKERRQEKSNESSKISKTLCNKKWNFYATESVQIIGKRNEEKKGKQTATNKKGKQMK